MTTLAGSCIVFGDNINTGTIISVKHLSRAANAEELIPFLFESLRPGVATHLNGVIIVGGENFGSGSSREHPVHALKAAGVQAVLAKSFARSFFRNAINLGLPAIEVDTTDLRDGDEIEIDLARGVVHNRDRGMRIPIRPLPKVMSELLSAGGLVPYFRKHGRL